MQSGKEEVQCMQRFMGSAPVRFLLLGMSFRLECGAIIEVFLLPSAEG